MTSDTMVVDPSQDWALACDVQQQFMGHLGTGCPLDYSAQSQQARAMGGDCYDFIPRPTNTLG